MRANLWTLPSWPALAPTTLGSDLKRLKPRRQGTLGIAQAHPLLLPEIRRAGVKAGHPEASSQDLSSSKAKE